jgi:choline dehydrogenase-like flavoprotein
MSIGDRLRWWYWSHNREFLEKLSETLIGEGKHGARASGSRVMDSVEAFLRSIPSHVFQQITLALIILPIVVPARLPRRNLRRLLVKIWMVVRGQFVRRRFASLSWEHRAAWIDEVMRRLVNQLPEQQDDLIKTAIIFSQIKTIICAHYFELDEVWKSIQYSPYPQPPRSWTPPSGPIIENPPRTHTGDLLHGNVHSLASVARRDPARTNYCVIGSGAGGAVAAWTIQQLDRNARVVMLEAGPLVTNEAFPLHILEASARLYMNSGITLSKDMVHSFRQGRCVGGSTTLNNAVAFKPEGWWWTDNIVERWRAVGAELDWDELHRTYDEIGPLLNVHPIEPRIVTSMADTVAEGFRRQGYQASPVPTNSLDCIGCGRCNCGCQYDAKRSMLVTTIPEFVRGGGLLVPDAKVERLIYSKTDGQYAVSGVVAKDAAGHKVVVEADKVVMAAGAYASTKLLWKSGFTGTESGTRTVGMRFVGNMGTPLVGRFPEEQAGARGQQVGFAIALPPERIVIETAFGTPGVIGLLAAQWGNKFMEVVESYNRMAVAVPVLAGEVYGHITRGFLPTESWLFDYRLGGFVIDYSMGAEDWIRLTKALKLAAKGLFLMGAEEVYTTRFSAKSLKPGSDIDAHFNGLSPIDCLKIESAHLHGGNVIHRDPTRGVVDRECKVHGFWNLWITDGSVIPAAITLNLQFTIMAVARYAAKRIVAAPLR